jgi:glycosyltransferase involved in cell wall biosynthesis
MNESLEEPALISAIIPTAGFPNGTWQVNQWISDPALSFFEVLFVLDSDSIELRQQIESIASRISSHTRVKILQSKCRNPGGARNIGLDHATGHWIAFWDCDDIPNPAKYLEIVRNARATNADVAMGAFVQTNGSRNMTFQIKSRNEKTILQSIALNPGLWRFAFKSDLAKKTKFPEIRMAEDQIYLMETFSKMDKLLSSEEIIYQYWVYSDGQLTKNENALGDLNTALSIAEKRFHATNVGLDLIFLVRLLLTKLKKSKNRSKYRTGARIVQLLLTDSRTMRILIRIVLNTRKHNEKSN